jgi:hypothetical protein
MLWAILAKYGIPPATIATIKKMYFNIVVNVRVGKEKEEFMSMSGVKQGDNLAPILFLFVIQAAVKTMHQNWPTAKPNLEWCPDEFVPGTGLQHKGSLTQCSNKAKDNMSLIHSKSFYTDDAAFIFLSYHDLITITKRIRDGFWCFGLHARIIAATKAWNAMRLVLLDKHTHIDIHRKLYMAIPVNILLWGCNSWALSSSHFKNWQPSTTGVRGESVESLCGIANTTIFQCKSCSKNMWRCSQ